MPPLVSLTYRQNEQFYREIGANVESRSRELAEQQTLVMYRLIKRRTPVRKRELKGSWRIEPLPARFLRSRGSHGLQVVSRNVRHAGLIEGGRRQRAAGKLSDPGGHPRRREHKRPFWTGSIFAPFGVVGPAVKEFRRVYQQSIVARWMEENMDRALASTRGKWATPLLAVARFRIPGR